MQRFLWLLLLIVFVAFIFFNSSMPASDSKQASELVTALVSGVCNWLNLDFPQDNLEHNIRKLAHFLEFAMLGYILCNLFSSFGASRKVATGYILFLGLAIAVTDEYIQLFSPGRSGQITDVMLDFSGVFVVWLTRQVWNWAKR